MRSSANELLCLLSLDSRDSVALFEPLTESCFITIQSRKDNMKHTAYREMNHGCITVCVITGLARLRCLF